VRTSTDLTEEALDALAGAVRQHHGLESLLPERARAAALASDRRRSTGPVSALDGIPYAAKDAFAAVGGPTTWGSDRWAERSFDEDAGVIERLDVGGAVLTAKLAMVELAGFGATAGTGEGRQGPARNPWAPDRYAGGSSGGSAIAVACGAVPFALGTETGGSVVGPAALCGVTGFRPTQGRLTRSGMLTLSPTLDKPGVLARSAVDCGFVLGVLSDAVLREAQPAEVGAMRVGLVEDEAADWNSDIAEALGRAVGVVARTNWVVRLERRLLGDPSAPLRTLMLAEAAFALRAELADPAFSTRDPGQAAALRSAEAITATDYLAARAARARLGADLARAFQECDVIIAATRADVARPLGTPRTPTAGPLGPSVADALRAGANLAGLPGVSLPAGLSRSGLPVALHVVAPAGWDERALAFGARFQQLTDHHRLSPPAAVPLGSSA
jgi:aspartyl-tRNA(Asn)/glutamyl-tRNA(Gln) amidotransferase subunit A